MKPSNSLAQLCCLVTAAVFLFLGIVWFQSVHAAVDAGARSAGMGQGLEPGVGPGFGPGPGQRNRDRVRFGDGMRFRDEMRSDDGISRRFRRPWGSGPDDVSIHWEGPAGWVDPALANKFGVRRAMAPKMLSLSWHDDSTAIKWELYQAYSPVPFPEKKIPYSLLKVTSVNSFQSGGPHPHADYQKLGYYRFRVKPMFANGLKGPFSFPVELVLEKKRPLTQISPTWVGNPCWNAKDHKNYAGPSVASAPQNLWLDWDDLDGAMKYNVFWAYSPQPFTTGKINYQLLVTPTQSAYHSADVRFLTGAARKFTQTGYYRFKVTGVSATGATSKESAYRDLVLH